MDKTATWTGSRYEIPYDDGEHMMQTYISDDGQTWQLIGYDGVLRDISDDDDFFNSLTIRLDGK